MTQDYSIQGTTSHPCHPKKHITKDLPDVSVAVVDDDPLVLKTIGLLIKKLIMNVQLFDDPKKCLLSISKDPVDILITDLDMPGLNGLDLMDKVKKVSPSTDIVVITGGADKKAAIEALKLGALDFFEKPVTGEELKATLKRTVAYRQAISERNRPCERAQSEPEHKFRFWLG